MVPVRKLVHASVQNLLIRAVSVVPPQAVMMFTPASSVCKAAIRF